jgi:predicted ATPase
MVASKSLCFDVGEGALRIESLEVQNFKVLRHLKLDDLPNLVVIAGPNGSGKTSLFDAIRVFKEAIATYSLQTRGAIYINQLLQQVGPVVRAGKSTATITVSIRVSEAERQAMALPDDHSGLLSGTVTVRTNPDAGQREYAQLVGSGYGNMDAQYLQQLLGGYRTGGVLGMIDHIGPDRRFTASQVTNISFSDQEEEQELQRLILNTTDKFASLTQDLVRMSFIDMQEQTKGVEEPHEYIEGVRQIFQHFLPEQEFVDVDLPIRGMPQITVRSSGVEHDINQLSSGQREILMTYTHLEKLQPTGSVILFDEPELHLHPTLQRRVIAHLRRLTERGSNQIWAITQSEGIVDTTEYESLFAMNSKGDPAIEHVTERAGQINLFRHLGANVGLQLISPRILFVEGSSDAELLPRFYGELPANISIVGTGGKGKLMRLTPAAMKLLDETIEGGQFYFVRDRDVEDDPTGIDELEEKHKGYFFTWDRYHIENYLLDEVSIYHVLEDDPDIPNSFGSVSEVRQQLRRIADERKPDVLARHLEARINPTLRQRVILNVPDGVESSLLKAAESRLRRTEQLLEPDAVKKLFIEVGSEIDARWDDEWQKLCVGRDVLERFHRDHVHGLDFEVFRNKVARKIRKLERVPEPIKKVMSTLTADLI